MRVGRKQALALGVLAVVGVVAIVLGIALSVHSNDSTTTDNNSNRHGGGGENKRITPGAASDEEEPLEPESDPTTETYTLSALAIGDWGRTVAKEGGSCCQRRKSYSVLDLNAMEYTATLLGLAAASMEPRPSVIIGHGDNFYWTGLQSESDQQYRFHETFEAKYADASLRGIPWVNVMGNHDYGGASFVCSSGDAPAQCQSTEELLEHLGLKFSLQSNYVSPNDNRWRMPARFFVHTLVAESPKRVDESPKRVDESPKRVAESLKAVDESPKRVDESQKGVAETEKVVVEIFNTDTNDAESHGAQQICCQCYGYSQGDDSACEAVTRGDAYCAGGDTRMFDACMAQLKEWAMASRAQFAAAAAASNATWKVVNTHYSPYNHYSPQAASAWYDVLARLRVNVFFYGHTHGEKHDYAKPLRTHFIENGAGGGIQNESPSGIPPYATEYVENVWAAGHYPYGIFSIKWSRDWAQVQFLTFDSDWRMDTELAATVVGGVAVQHCWFIPRSGGRGRSCIKGKEQQST